MKRLYRSKEHKVIGGVAGGLADFLDLDITIVRLAIAVLALIIPNVVIAYLIAWVIVPEGSNTVTVHEKVRREVTETVALEDRANPDLPAVADASVNDNDRKDTGAKPVAEVSEKKRVGNREQFGYFLIAVGLLFLAKKHVPTYILNLPARFISLSLHTIRIWWPVVIVALGIVLIGSAMRRDG